MKFETENLDKRTGIFYDIIGIRNGGIIMGFGFDIGDLIDIGLQVARSVEARDERHERKRHVRKQSSKDIVRQQKPKLSRTENLLRRLQLSQLLYHARAAVHVLPAVRIRSVSVLTAVPP